MGFNAEAVRNEAEFIGIAEIPVDVHPLHGMVCSGMGRHGAIGGFIRVIRNHSVFWPFYKLSKISVKESCLCAVINSIYPS